MAALRQFEANRRNSQQSTGPKTPEGKAAVSMNALRHGLRARTVVLPGEDRNEFKQLCGDLEIEWTRQSDPVSAPDSPPQPQASPTAPSSARGTASLPLPVPANSTKSEALSSDPRSEFAILEA